MIGLKKRNERNLTFMGDSGHWFEECLLAIERGGFSNIQDDKASMSIKADYHKFTVWGNIEITLSQSDNDTTVNAIASAKSDNIYAMAQDPSEKILLAFKNNLPRA